MVKLFRVLTSCPLSTSASYCLPRHHPRRSSNTNCPNSPTGLVPCKCHSKDGINTRSRTAHPNPLLRNQQHRRKDDQRISTRPLYARIDCKRLTGTKLWQLSAKLPLASSKDAKDQMRLRREVLRLKREMNAISAQDDFARWAKIRRQHDKALAEHDKKGRIL